MIMFLEDVQWMDVEKIEGYIPKLFKLVIPNCKVTRGFIFFYHLYFLNFLHEQCIPFIQINI